jgi:hypothetical protein
MEKLRSEIAVSATSAMADSLPPGGREAGSCHLVDSVLPADEAFPAGYGTLHNLPSYLVLREGSREEFLEQKGLKTCKYLPMLELSHIALVCLITAYQL